MPVYVRIEAGRAIKQTTKWTKRIPVAVKQGNELVANRIARRIRDTAVDKGLVVTGYLSSKKGTFPVKIAENRYAIMMPGYTENLEKGTRAHYIPRTWKTQLAAKKYGMSFSMLRAIISRWGTRQHGFVASVIEEEFRDNSEIIKRVNNVINR